MPILDVSDAVAELAGGGPFTVTRRAAPTLTDGIATPGATSTFTLADPSIQPGASPRDLQRLPDGVRTRDALTVFTTSALLLGDRISYQGDTYEVGALEDWTAQGGYVEAIATKVDPP